jgi:hypothetical protein
MASLLTGSPLLGALGTLSVSEILQAIAGETGTFSTGSLVPHQGILPNEVLLSGEASSFTEGSLSLDLQVTLTGEDFSALSGTASPYAFSYPDSGLYVSLVPLAHVELLTPYDVLVSVSRTVP